METRYLFISAWLGGQTSVSMLTKSVITAIMMTIALPPHPILSIGAAIADMNITLQGGNKLVK